MRRIIKKLEELISEGKTLYQESIQVRPRRSNRTESEIQAELDRRTLFDRKMRKWKANRDTLLGHMKMGAQIAQINEIEKLRFGGFSRTLNQSIGVLESAREMVQAGFVGNLKFLLHADFFGSILEEADHLRKTGHTIPAAVLGRIVIERWLQDEAEKQGVQDCDTKKASRINDELKSVGALSTAKWRLVQGHLGVGNAAAHGKTDDFTENDVKQMLDFAKSNCV